MITSEDFFRYCLSQEYLTALKFYFSTMTIPLSDKTDYFIIKNKKYIVNYNGKEEEISNKTTDEPLFNLKDTIRLFNEDIPSVNKVVDTTIGRAIVNYVLLSYNFGDKIEYINESTNISKIEKIIADYLNKDKIEIEEYVNFVDSCSMLESLSRITTISATYKTMTPPPGIIKFKKDLIDKYDKVYGKRWVKDSVKVIEFGNELKAKDAEYLKDDPTNGKLTSGKIKDNARPNMYLSMGTEDGFGLDSDSSTLIYNSLLEGYPTNFKQLTAIYNSSRSGSFSRGAETQESGVVSKKLLRATATVVIEEGDCKSNIYKKIKVTKDIANTLEGRYYKNGNSTSIISNPDKLIGKTIELRSPMYCKLKGKRYCGVCCGNKLTNYRKGATIIATDIGSVLMTTFLKKMHTNVKHLVKTNPIEMLI